MANSTTLKLACRRLRTRRCQHSVNPNNEVGLFGDMNWTAQEVKLLGTGPDREIARRTGRTTLAVQTKRLILGIRSWRSKNIRVREPVEPEKSKLLFGPYHPPRTRPGRFLFCE